MSFSEFRFTTKPQDELRKQLDYATKRLGVEAEKSLVPLSVSKNEILAMPLADIQKKYTRRYEIYLSLMKEFSNFRYLEKGGKSNVALSEEKIGEMKKWIIALNSLDRYIRNHTEGNGEKTLRERQLTVFEDLRDFLEGGGRSGYVKLPTGFGKTVLFTEFIEALDLKTLIVVPTKLLVEQTGKRVEQFAPDLEVGKIYSEAKQRGRQVTITTYNSLVGQIDNGTLEPDDFDCLILDEAHLALGPTRLRVIKKFNKALRLGFTATPHYSKKSVRDILETEIHQMNIREGVEEGLLSSFSSIIAKTEADLSKVKITETGEYDEQELSRAVNTGARNMAAVDIYRDMFNGELAVVYCVGIKHADTMAKFFNERGVPAAAISGSTSEKEAQRLFKAFFSGEIRVLCNADLLIAGFDEPKASVCLNLRPTRSRVVAEQRGGRVLRIDQNNLKKHAYVVDFLDKEIDLKRYPVLFADVAGGAAIKYRERAKEGGKGGGERPVVPPVINIEGLEVIVDVEEIMRIVGEINIASLPDRKRIPKIPFDQLKIEVAREGIDVVRKYKYALANHPNWPADPSRYYQGQWRGYADFFGKEEYRKAIHREVAKIGFDELKAEVLAAGVQSQREYAEVLGGHPTWPTNPQKYMAYKGRWVSWPDFFGRVGRERIEKLDLEQLKKAVKILGISSQQQYRAIVKLRKDFPAAPDRLFREHGWVSWFDLFGREKPPPKISLDKLKQEVVSMGIDSVAAYVEVAKTRSSWPASPDQFYKESWKSWPDLFNREVVPKISLDQLKSELRGLGVTKREQYYLVRRTRPHWPANPSSFYRNRGWVNWPDLFGRENK